MLSAPRLMVARRYRSSWLTMPRYCASSALLRAARASRSWNSTLSAKYSSARSTLLRQVHAPHHRAQLFDLVDGDAPRGELADQPFERGAHLVELVGLFDRDLAHEHAAVLFHAHQAGLAERTEGLAHRAARHAQRGGDLDLVELGAGGDLAGDDAPLQLLLRQRGQRMLAQHLDGHRGVGGPLGHRGRRGCRLHGHRAGSPDMLDRQFADCQQNTKHGPNWIQVLASTKRTPCVCARRRGSSEATLTGWPRKASKQRASVSSSRRCIASCV